MELVHVAATASQRDEVVALAARHVILFQSTDAETVLVAASFVNRVTSDFGVWLTVSAAYPAQLAARDVATLAALVPLRHVVIEARSTAHEHADVVRALLTNDEVNFTNSVVRLVGAFNRPAPPEPITVWSYDAGRLTSGGELLTRRRVEDGDAGEMTFFA